tara:strand:- start:8255 stop:8374 length:120 start_codon:yes stop_codon:yes gene_type:complete
MAAVSGALVVGGLPSHAVFRTNRRVPDRKVRTAPSIASS